MTRKETLKPAMLLPIVVALYGGISAQTQTPAAGGAARTGSLRQIIPGHYVYTTNNEGRLFNSGVVATNDGVLVFDALDTDAIARAERQAIANTIKQPIRYLVSSPFHDPFNGGSAVYADVLKIAHENYRAGLIDQMQRGNVPADVQRARMPNATYRDRMTFYLGGKEIQVLHFGSAHTKGDSVLFVPQDRIAYLSEVFFNEEFPNMAGGYGVSWVKALDALKALDADIFIRVTAPFPTIRSRRVRRWIARGRSSWMPATESRVRLRAAPPKIRRSLQSSSISTPSCMRSWDSGKLFSDEFIES